MPQVIEIDDLDDSRTGAPLPAGSARCLGGKGTALVWELAVADASAELGMTTWSARRLMADALDVRHRLPRLWAGLVDGSVLATRQLSGPTYRRRASGDEPAGGAGRLTLRTPVADVLLDESLSLARSRRFLDAS